MQPQPPVVVDINEGTVDMLNGDGPVEFNIETDEDLLSDVEDSTEV